MKGCRADVFSLRSDIIGNFRCILCGTSRAEVLEEIPTGKRTYYHLRCVQCGLIFGAPIDRQSIEEMDAFNTQTWEADKFNEPKFLRELDAFRNTFTRQLCLMEAHGGKGPLLEVGPGLGLFLKVASERGWDCRGVDVSRHAAAFISKVAQVPCDHGTIDSVALPQAHYRVVRLRHILEHQENPLEFLGHIFRVLTDDGIVLIDVPNALGTYYSLKTLLSLFSGSRIRHVPLSLPAEHLFAFTPLTLRMLVEKAGFRVIRLQTACLREKSYFPIRSLSTWRERFIHLCDLLGKLVNRGSVIILCAQKRL